MIKTFDENELFARRIEPSMVLDFAVAKKENNEFLEPVLFYGCRNKEHEAFAYKLAEIYGTEVESVHGRFIHNEGDLMAIFTSIHDGQVLFIDEVDKLNMKCSIKLREYLCNKRSLDLMIGKGPAARSIEIILENFMIVGTTEELTNVASMVREGFEYFLELGE